MKRLFLLCAGCCALAISGFSQKKQLTDEQIVKGANGIEKPVPLPMGWADASHYLLYKGSGADRKVYAVDVRSGEEAAYKPATATFSVLLKENDIYFMENGNERRLTTTPELEKNPTLSPDNQWVAFTRNNNLYAIRVADGKEIRYTDDGSDLILNGWASWVYYEEILGRATRYRAFWWSPDSRKIAFFRSDDTRVPMFPIYNSEGKHGFLEETRYPKAGDPNPTVRVGIVGVEGGAVQWAAFNENDDQYFGQPFWRRDGSSLIVQWMNRDQNNLKLYDMDPSNGAVKAIYDEKQPTWIDWIEGITWVSDGFLLVRDFDGWEQIYYHNNDGSLKKKLTAGNLWGTQILAANEKEKTVYFVSNGEISTRRDLYCVRLDGTKQKRLTFGEYSHNVQLSPDCKQFLTAYSNVATPTRLALVDVKTGKVKELADGKDTEFDQYELALPEMHWLETADGFRLPGTIIWPLHLDPNKKYPVIISIYGGPNAGSVSDTWRSVGAGNQWWAKEGVIQVNIDHRGSGKCGKKGMDFMHRNLGKWEMEDYIAWVKYLCEKPFVDDTKIGINGGSYGGYVTAFALTYGSEYFNYGIASFSVTDWMLYDSHYTERYMDAPADNPEGYAFNSVMTHAGKYKGGPNSMLRIVHGTMDDNVHLQNSIQLVDKLENLNKEFEFMLYPGERHGWGGAKAIHSQNDSYRFWYRYLFGKEAPAIILK